MCVCVCVCVCVCSFGTVAVVAALSELCVLADVFDAKWGSFVRWTRRDWTGAKR